MSNFGVAFHNLLKRIHYPGLNQYEPYNFDWFVYQPGLEPFLTWIVTQISDENILTDDELTRFAALKDQIIENPDERQKLLEILISLDNGKIVIPWTNYQRNLTEQFACIKNQTQALKNQLTFKQQQYKTFLMKNPKTKEKIRESRRQIENLLQLTSPQNLQSLVQTSTNCQFEQITTNFLQLERNYLSILQNVWTDEILFEQNANLDLIKQLNHRTVKLVRLEVEVALANVEFDTLKSQIQLCSQLKKYFDSTSLDDLRKLAERLGSKSQIQQQQRNQLENQLAKIFSTRHEENLEKIYFQILDKQLTNDENLHEKQKQILDGLVQQRDFCQFIEKFIDQRFTLIDRTNEKMTKILQFIQNLFEQIQMSNVVSTSKNEKENLQSIVNDLPMNNLIERMKTIENEFLTNQSIVHNFLDYVQKQNEDFRPKFNDLSKDLNRHVDEKICQWKKQIETIE